jgi:hypothetical protein
MSFLSSSKFRCSCPAASACGAQGAFGPTLSEESPLDRYRETTFAEDLPGVKVKAFSQTLVLPNVLPEPFQDCSSFLRSSKEEPAVITQVRHWKLSRTAHARTHFSQLVHISQGFWLIKQFPRIFPTKVAILEVFELGPREHGLEIHD